MLVAVIYVPFLRPIFQTVPLGLAQWELILPLLILPSVAAEVTKWFLGWRERRELVAA